MPEWREKGSSGPEVMAAAFDAYADQLTAAVPGTGADRRGRALELTAGRPCRSGAGGQGWSWCPIEEGCS